MHLSFHNMSTPFTEPCFSTSSDSLPDVKITQLFVSLCKVEDEPDLGNVVCLLLPVFNSMFQLISQLDCRYLPTCIFSRFASLHYIIHYSYFWFVTYWVAILNALFTPKLDSFRFVRL